MRQEPPQPHRPRERQQLDTQRPLLEAQQAKLRQAIFAALVSSLPFIAGAPDKAAARGQTLEEVQRDESDRTDLVRSELLRRWIAGSSSEKDAVAKENPEFVFAFEHQRLDVISDYRASQERAQQLAVEYKDRLETLIEDIGRIERSLTDRAMVEGSLKSVDNERSLNDAGVYAMQELHALQLWEKLAPLVRGVSDDDLTSIQRYPDAQNLATLRGVIGLMDDFLKLPQDLRDRAMIKFRFGEMDTSETPLQPGFQTDRG